MGKPYWIGAPIVICLMVAAFFAGQWTKEPSGQTRIDQTTPPSPVPTPSPPPVVTDPPASEPVVAKEGQAVRVNDLPLEQRPKTPPPSVGNKVRIRQYLHPGKTYRTLTRGTLYTRGDDKAWGLQSVVSINYMFEAQVDREIESNDGEVIVERRHFRDVRSIKIDVALEDARINLETVNKPILVGAALLWPKSALAIKAVDNRSLKPIIDLLRTLGLPIEKMTGLESKAVKVFTQFDSLAGKSVEIEYRDGEGVPRVVPLVGVMLESERFLHFHSVLISDAIIFPNPEIAEGEPWTVDGRAFSDLVDPGLRAAVGGEISMRRGRGLNSRGRDLVPLRVEGGRLTLTSSDPEKGDIGWFEPRGTMRFSPKDQVIVEATLSGKGHLAWVGANHPLFRTEMRHTPEMSVFYTCRVIDSQATDSR